MARVSKFGITSILFGLLLLYFDQGSDIWVGVNFYNACHYRWALTSFLLTSMQTFAMIFYMLFYALNNPKGVKVAIFFIFSAIFQPLFALVIVVIIVICQPDDEDNTLMAKDTIGILKLFKVAEVVFEAVGQLIFNIYVRSYLAPSDGIDGYVQVGSIILSYIAIIHGIGDRYACFYRDELMPSIQNVCLSMCIIFFDISLKLSIYVLSLLIYGIYATIGWITALVLLLACVHIFLTAKYPESIEDRNSSNYIRQGSGTKSNLFEMIFLSLTDLPNAQDLKIKNISFRIRINKIVTYVTFIIGLIIMTRMIVVHQSDPTVYDWMNHIGNEDVSSSTLNCENLCDADKAFNNMQAALKNETSPWAKLINPDPDVSDEFSGLNMSQIFDKLDYFGINNETQNSVYYYISIKKDMNCSKMLLTSSHLLIWIGMTWFLLAFCIVQAICDYKKCGIFVKLHDMIAIEENDNKQEDETREKLNDDKNPEDQHQDNIIK